MESIKIINLKVTKVQETETETDSGITNKWTYTLQDDDKTETITLKTSLQRKIKLGNTIDVKFCNDQTTLEVTVTNEAEALTEIIDEQGLMDKVVEKIEKHPELAEIVKGKLAEYNNLKDKKEALGKLLEKAKAAKEEPDFDDYAKQIEENEINLDKKKDAPKDKEHCPFHYRDGLCSNSQMERPFCAGIDNCPVWNEPAEKEKPKSKKQQELSGWPELPELELPIITANPGYMIKGKIEVKTIGTADTWEEEFLVDDIEDITLNLDRFNNALKAGEKEREIVNILNHKFVKTHRWSKQNLVSNDDGSDTWQCEDCLKEIKFRIGDSLQYEGCKPKKSKKPAKKKVPPGTPSKKKELASEKKPAKKWREPSATSPRGQALQRLRNRADDMTLKPTEDEIQEEKNNPKEE